MHQLVELSIEVTNECRLSCLHCSSGSSLERLPDELTPIEHMVLIKQARDLGATVLSLSGGDPLMYESQPMYCLTALIDAAQELGYEKILVYTTGHGVQGATIDKWSGIDYVMKHCPNAVWIFSLHSHKVAVNDWIMNVPGTTENIKSSIRWLVSRGQQVEVHMVPMKPNFQHIPDMIELCSEMGVAKLSLLRFVPQTRGLANYDDLAMSVIEFAWMQAIIEVAESSGRIQDLAIKHKWHLTDLRLGCPIDFRHAMGWLNEKAKPCHAGDDLILVRPNGDVHPCAAWKSLPSDDNVREHSLEHIWHNSRTFQFIRDFKENEYEKVGQCVTCPYLHSCKSGCLAQRLHACGKSLDDLYDYHSDPLCPRRLAKDEDVHSIATNLLFGKKEDHRTEDLCRRGAMRSNWEHLFGGSE